MQSKVMRGSRTTFRHFFQKSALYSTRILGFPFGEAVGFCRLKRSLQSFPLPEKKFSKLHFFGKNCQPLRGFPLGGSSLQSKVVRGSRTTIRHFFQIAALYSNRIPGFPRRGSCRLLPTEEVFASLPLALRQGFPLGGSSLRSKVVRGNRTTFRHFSRQKAALYSNRILGFPLGEAVGFCRLKRSLQDFPP